MPLRQSGLNGLICETDYCRNGSKGFQLPPSAPSNRSYVAKFFSSKIISNELSTIKTAISQSEFDDENVEVRVNEVTKEINTKYQVEEGQKNEMSIRLPPSYPLVEVEIVGNSRVGVTQDRWNKWILTCKIACKVCPPSVGGLQQNGTIVDALTLFVSNVKGYFAHLNECAICYGVIAVDRTLPTKQCPNGHWFHALCLFKVLSLYQLRS